MKISPSILTCDFLKLETELKSISNADYLHLDIMDGHFVNNISFGPYISSVISQKTNLPLDIHLMITNPLNFIDKFNFSNTSIITVHAEIENVQDSISKIKSLGLRAGISIKPNTSVDNIKNILEQIDLVLVMSVEPGYGGQKFMENALEKVKLLNEMKKDYNYNYIIEVDGGINKETATLVSQVGADLIVVGSYLFNQKNRKKIIKEFQSLK